jgi:hypothetical protein
MIEGEAWKAIFNPGSAEDFFRTAPLLPFDPGQPGYSAVNAWWLAELSRLIYKKDRSEDPRAADGPTRAEILATVGLQEERFFDNGRVQCALISGCRERRFAVLVFRGTRGKLEAWRSNFDARQVRWPGGGMVHGGFMALFEGIWPLVDTTLRSLSAPLFLTGHSLGAAMATLTAALHAPQAVYTFGSPRVGDRRFAASLAHLRIYRVFNPLDIVAALPPSLIPLEFCHAGEPHATPPDRPNPVHLAAQAGGLQPPRFLAHHAPLSYSQPLLAAGRS